MVQTSGRVPRFTLRGCRFYGRRFVGDDGEFSCFPCGDAACQLDEIADPTLAEEAGCDGGTIASGAVYRYTAVVGDAVDALFELREGEVDATGDVTSAPFSGSADVDDDWWVRGSQFVCEHRGADAFGGL